MASKFSPAVLGSALVMGSDFIMKLHTELVNAGGGEAFLHFLTTKRGGDALRAAAEAAVKHRLPVPRSFIEKLVMEHLIENFASSVKDLERVMLYSWDDIDLQRTFGIDVLRFCNTLDLDGKRPGLMEMPELIKQIVGKPLAYPLIVQYNNQPMVVVDLHLKKIGTPAKDQVLMEEDFVGDLKIAPAKYFDLEH
jgi:hypothetical protein